MILALTPQLASAGNKICFDNLSSAKDAAAKIQFEQKQLQFWQQKYTFCNAERINLDGQQQSLNLMVTKLTEDKEALKQVAEDYKKNYLETNAALMKSEASKPSRFTWFGIGAITSAVLGLAAAFAAK